MNKIKQYREAAKLTQTQIGDRLGVSGMMVSKYENGNSDPSLEQSRAIVSLFNEVGTFCTLDEVFPPKTETSITNEVA